MINRVEPYFQDLEEGERLLERLRETYRRLWSCNDVIVPGTEVYQARRECEAMMQWIERSLPPRARKPLFTTLPPASGLAEEDGP
jgi:hypothetical protein